MFSLGKRFPVKKAVGRLLHLLYHKSNNMKIEVHTVGTTTPEKLWVKIKKYIAEEKIKTWVFVKNDKGVELLTHTPAGGQWHKKALLKESLLTTPSRLVFTVIWFTDSVPDEYTKGLYIGRFTEELLEHFRADFSKLETFA
jgi:hypothetical protein